MGIKIVFSKIMMPTVYLTRVQGNIVATYTTLKNLLKGMRIICLVTVDK